MKTIIVILPIMKDNASMFFLISVLLFFISILSALSQPVIISKKNNETLNTNIITTNETQIIIAGQAIKYSDIYSIEILTNDEKSKLLAGRLKEASVIVIMEGVKSEIRYENWYLRNREAVFEKIYENDIDSIKLFSSLYSYLKTKSFIRDLEILDGTIKGRIENWTIDYKKYGGSWGFTAGGFRSGKWTGSFSVMIKKNKYKVVGEGFSVDMGSINVYYGYGIGASNNSQTNWSEWILKKDRTEFKISEKSDATFLSLVLTDLFDVKNAKKADSDW